MIPEQQTVKKRIAATCSELTDVTPLFELAHAGRESTGRTFNLENRPMIPKNRPVKQIATACSELIGGTPLYELARTGSGSRLLLKLEQFNPTGSCKVRMAREMILAAERDGKLKPGGHIVEPTSGNTGMGLALVAIERGYKFTAIVDNHASRDKLRAMQAMGVNLVFAESKGDGPSTVERRRLAGEIVEATGAFWPDQHYLSLIHI